jgi:AraC family transcriptional regulator
LNYFEQLEKAVVFIENNLNRKIKVEEVAGSVGYSYYHFHRIFEAVLGETVGNYIRSRRLRRAADDLLYTDKRILDIAVEYQFESQEAFNRAFKKVYKAAPGIYRKDRIDTIVGSKKELTPSWLKHLQENVTIQPVIKEIGDILLVGITGKTTLKNNKIPQLWSIFNSRFDEIENRLPDIRGYGVCETDIDFDMSKFSEDTETVHFVGAEVSSLGTIPDGMNAKVVKGGKYAVFTHKGKLENLRLTYDYIWGTWVLCSGFEIAPRDDFEFYDDRFLGPAHPMSEFDIFIPVI